jgi:U3 small nucleolar RNA-associated protein 3
MLQTATALNVCQYLMIKNGQAVAASNEADDYILDTRESDIIKNHPVIGRLNQLNHLAEKLESDIENKVNGLESQMKTLIKASSLMVSGEDIEESGSDDDDDDQSMDGSHDREVDSEVEEEETLKHDEASTASSSDEDEDEIAVQRRIMNEARFALRKHDDEGDNEEDKKRTRRAVPTFSDFGDEDDAAEADVSAAGRSLAATVNKITQRSKGKKDVTQNAEYDEQENEERFKRGLEMMENELGEDEEDMSGEMNELPFSEDEEDDFYSEIAKKSKAKKEYKKSLYAVAPKYPGMDEEIEGERSISRQILKNRGLVAHKAKINRNPRVKKREQYRKALIKRKGAVREVRTDEGHKYAGEQTGIKSGLSRSRKLGVR